MNKCTRFHVLQTFRTATRIQALVADSESELLVEASSSSGLTIGNLTGV